MSAEVIKDDSRCLKTTEDENVGKDTVECSSPVSSVPDEPTSPNPNSDSSSDRPKLSKQCVIDEEGSNHLSENELQATPTETGTKEHNNRGKQLIRSHAMCGDDDTRLRPPPEGLNKQKLSSKSVSRDSTATCATDYTDASGVDLYAFIISTLHKNPKDRQMVLELEKSLTGFVQDTSKLSLKFGAMSSYNRMLIHRVAAYFGLDHNVDQSGQCVVVNKNEHSRLPEIEFSSLIQGNYYTEGRSTGRFSRRDIHSFEEMRDFSPVSTGAWSSVDAYRKARSFGANNVPYQIPPLYTSPYNQYTPTSQYMLSPRDSYAIAQQRSLDAGIDHSQLEWSDGRNGSVPVFQKAGSFGGVPAYYQQREGYAKVAPPSSIHDDDVTALSETTGSTSGRKAPSSNAYPPPLMSVRVPEPPYDPTMATRYADVMDNNGSQSQGQTTAQGPQMQYYPQQPQYYSPPIQSPIYTPTPPLQQQFDGLAQEMAAMSLQQNSSTSSNASYQNTQPIRSTPYYPSQSVPMAMGYNTQMCYPMSTPQMFVPRTMAVYPTQYPPNTVSYGYVYQGQQTYAPYPQHYGENVYACQPYMAPNGAVYYTQPPMSNNAGYTPHTHESVPPPPTTTGIQNGHPTLSHSHDHGYGSMTQESLNQSDSIDHCEQTHA